MLRDTLAPHFGGFWDALGCILVAWEGPGDRLEMWSFFRGTLGEPGLRAPTPGKVTVCLVGSSKQVTNHRLPISKQLKADTRLVNCQLQTGGLEMSGNEWKLDCQLVI